MDRFSLKAFGIEEGDVFFTIFCVEGSGKELFALAHSIRGAPFNDVTVGSDPAEGNQHSAPHFFDLALSIERLHHNDAILDLIEDLGGRKGYAPPREENCDETYRMDQPYHRRYLHSWPLPARIFILGALPRLIDLGLTYAHFITTVHGVNHIVPRNK